MADGEEEDAFEEQSFRVPAADEEEALLAVDPDDYYALLNVSRDASDDEVRAAFRRASLIFHPDKHLASSNREAAEAAFKRVSDAAQILLDPPKRAIYDEYGVQGLRAGSELILASQGRNDMLDEYRRLMRQKDELLERRAFQPKSTIVVNVDASKLVSLVEPDGHFEGDGVLETIAIYAPDFVGASIDQSFAWALDDGNAMSVQATVKARKGFADPHVSFMRTFTPIPGLSTQFYAQVSDAQRTMYLGNLYKVYGNFTAGCVLTTAVANGALMFLPTAIGSYANERSRIDARVNLMNWDLSFQHATPGWNVAVSCDSPLDNPLPSSVQVKAVAKVNKELSFTTRVKLTRKGAMLNYGFERKINQKYNVAGTVTISDSAGISFTIKGSRDSHSIAIPILISPELTPASFIVGAVAPMCIAYLVQKFALDPYKARQDAIALEKRRRATRESRVRARARAVDEVRSMRDAVEHKVAQERARSGLIIVEGAYGRLDEEGDQGDGVSDESTVIDVRDALQALSNGGQLHLQASSKAGLLGFYDPCPGEPKSLRIKYVFRRRMHEVTIDDTDVLGIPMREHEILEPVPANYT